MALSTGDTSSQLTSQDLEALVSIQAELDRLGSNLVAEEDSAKKDAVEDILGDCSIEPGDAPPTSVSVQSSVDPEVATTNVGINSTASVGANHATVSSTSIADVRVLSSSAVSADVATSVIAEPSTNSLLTLVSGSHVSSLVTPQVKTVPTVSTIIQKAVLNKEPAGNPPKMTRPIYLIPNNSGSLTMSTVAPPGVSKLSGEGLVGKVVLATTTSASAATTAGVKLQPARNLMVEGRVIPTVLKTQSGGCGGGSCSGAIGSSPVITKVIITNNPISGQNPLASGQNAILTGLPQPVKIVTAAQAQALVGQNKTVTLSQAGLGSPLKQQIITTIPSTPPKQTIMLGKIALSPKTPTTITMIPVTMAKSPQRIAPAPVVTSTSTAASKLGSVTSSPSKFIIQQATPVTQVTIKPGVATTVSTTTTATTLNSTSGATIKQIAIPTSTVSSTALHPIQVPGNKFSYIRLVAAPTASVQATTTLTTSTSGNNKPQVLAPVIATTTKPITPVAMTTLASSQSSQLNAQTQQQASTSQVKVAVPIAPAISGQSLVSQKGVAGQQRILIPASAVTNVTQMRSTATSGIAVPTNALAQLPPGTTLFSPGSNIMMVPAQYVTQFQQPISQAAQAVSTAPVTMATTSHTTPILPAPPVGTATTVGSGGSRHSVSSASLAHDRGHAVLSTKNQLNGRPGLEPNGVRPRKPCNCTKSQCLKLYCDCFANGEFCHDCNCNNCYNNLHHEEERQKAIKACLERNPHAFHPKIGKSRDGEIERRHNKGCNCKRSGCLKNYCECYEAKIMCSYMCKCVGCKNFAESAEKKTLMHLADAAEVRVQQQTAAKNKLSSQMQDVSSKPNLGPTTGERIFSSFITSEVVEATCQCLLAQAEEGRKHNQSIAVVEQLVVQEFGRCLQQIIEYASKTKV